MASAASTLPWLWVVEALASLKQVDASILIVFYLLDLVKRTPEISDDLGKNTREMVSFRILESLAAQKIGRRKGVSSARDSTIEFNPSEHCEDVVRNILHEISASNLRTDEPEILKWDVQTFVKHKRANLSKCTLQQLKDAILQGNHPILASLRERSGLLMSKKSENRVSVDNGDPNAVSGRSGGNCSYGQTMIARGNSSSPTHKNLDGFLQGDSLDKDSSPSKRNRGDVDTKNQAERSHEDQNSVENGCISNLHIVKKLKKDAYSTNPPVGQESVLLIENGPSEDLFGQNGQHADMTKLSQMPNYLKLSQIIPNYHPIIESKDDEHCTETGTSSVTPPDGNHQNICGDEARDKCENSLLNTSNGIPLDESYQKHFSNEAKDDEDRNPGQEMSSDSDSYHDEKIDIARKKRTFLSSQCTSSQDSLETFDFTELNICMKCNKGGQLLVCSASACPLVVHESCLGYAPGFDDNGNFFCPFCAYSRAISEYLEVKKKTSLARKDLASFIGLESGHRANKFSKRFVRPEQDQLVQDDDNLNGNNQSNFNGSYVNEVNSCQNKENVRDKQQVGAGSQSASVLKGQQIEEQDVCNNGYDNSSCRDKEIIHATKRRAEDITQKEILQPPISDSTQQTAHTPNIDARERSDEENDKPTPSYSRSRPLRRREKQYTYPAIPQLRRKKVPWSSAEEEILKEGVRRFASVRDRNIPWKIILEFGSDVFEKGRTTIDLKDKWRNICKGSPKSK
ncbi:hypothetical protein U1Q18_040182 [Sarracenia purpurea var. burkii]